MITWTKGLLKQAQSDYEMYGKLSDPSVPICHRLHYLQMACEKLAKAFSRKKNTHPPKRHTALVSFLQHSKQRNIYEALGYANNPLAYSAYIDSLMDIALKIENLAPAGGGKDGKVNPEYPWKDAVGNIQVPVDYPYVEFSPQDFSKMHTLLSNLFRIAEEVIG
jgi:hypothetical protein